MSGQQDHVGCDDDSEAATTKRRVIEQAAIGEFSRRGFSATSMAHIAEAAGMSRPALYQYFRNKGDIFASAMTAVLEAAVDGSLAALDAPGSVADRLDGFLQRFDGDLWEATNASPISDELVSAKTDYAPRAFAEATERLTSGLRHHLASTGAGGPGRSGSEGDTRRDEWVELLRLGPKGFKYDEPSIEVFRARLSALARTVAADIEAAS